MTCFRCGGPLIVKNEEGDFVYLNCDHCGFEILDLNDRVPRQPVVEVTPYEWEPGKAG